MCIFVPQKMSKQCILGYKIYGEKQFPPKCPFRTPLAFWKKSKTKYDVTR